MPRATVDINDTVRLDLETCPGGYVVLRRMPYGKWLERQGMAMVMSMTKQASRGRGADDLKVDIEQAQKKVTQFEFSNCIVEHNLEDHTGALLDFRGTVALDLLDPRIGQEIGDKIDEMHNNDLGNSTGASEQQS